MSELPPLNCNGCRACCKNEQIWVLPEKGDDPSLYKTVFQGGKILMAPREDGRKECRYLGHGGCTIYPIRPFLCRLYDCRGHMMLKLHGKNREERRQILAKEPHLKEIFAAARERMGPA